MEFRFPSHSRAPLLAINLGGLFGVLLVCFLFSGKLSYANASPSRGAGDRSACGRLLSFGAESGVSHYAARLLTRIEEGTKSGVSSIEVSDSESFLYRSIKRSIKSLIRRIRPKDKTLLVADSNPCNFTSPNGSFCIDIADLVESDSVLRSAMTDPESRIPFTPNQTYRKLLEQNSDLTVDQEQILAGFFKNLRGAQIGAYTEKVGLRILAEMTEMVGNRPKRFDAVLFKSDTPLIARMRAITKVYVAALDRGSSVGARAAELSQWASNEDRARYVYEVLMDVAYPQERKIVLAFMRENRFFKDAVFLESDPAILITTSFEKETSSSAIVHYFKVPEFTDQAWKQQSEKDQYAWVQKWLQTHKPNTLVKRDDTPSFISSVLIDEGIAAGSDRRILEITKNGYAVTPHATKTQMREIAKITRETDSFHAHIVTEVAENDPLEFTQFHVWHEELNQTLLYLGLEEGLFPDGLTAKKSYKTDIKSLTPTLKTFGNSHWSDKLRGVGVRAGKYGNARKKGHVKLGLEPRDITRSMEKWENYIDRLSQAAAKRVWKNAPVNDPRGTNLGTFSVREIDVVNILMKERDIPEDIAGLIVHSTHSSTEPLLDFDQLKIIDWEKSQITNISPDILSRLSEEREKYLDGLKLLSKEIIAGQKAGNLRPDEIKMATQWWVMDWAKAAKPSEIFSSF